MQKKNVKLHVGSGSVHLPGYINMDVRYLPGVDDVCDVRFLRGYSDVDTIYACNVVEHFSRWEFSSVLSRWCKSLKEGGSLYISVPDFDAIVDYYKETNDLDSVIGLLYGGQDYEQNSHYYCWNFMTLKRDLLEAGFSVVEKYDWHEGPNPDMDDYSKAYLPHMDESGRLMVLNVKAIK